MNENGFTHENSARKNAGEAGAAANLFVSGGAEARGGRQSSRLLLGSDLLKVGGDVVEGVCAFWALE
jgi:hypothetical protein